MRWLAQSAWFGLGCGLAGGVLLLATAVLRPATVSVSPAVPASMLVDVVQPEPASVPPPIQRPSNMAVPEEPPQLQPMPLTLEVREVRKAWWDPDSAVSPSTIRTHAAAPKWDPDSAVPPPITAVRRTPPAPVWDPNSVALPR